MIQGRVIELRLTQLTQDIRNNWDTTYSVNVFLPAKEFDGEKINATKNRHIPSVMFLGVPLIAHGGRDDSILSAKLFRIAPENSSF